MHAPEYSPCSHSSPSFWRRAGNLHPQSVRASERIGTTIDLMLQIAALTELAVCWIVWILAFVKPSKQAAGEKEVSSAPVSWWGIFLVMVGFALIWAYVRPIGLRESSLCVGRVHGPQAASVRLRYWPGRRRVISASNGATRPCAQRFTGSSRPVLHRWLRHAIYASMLGMLLATGAAWTWWPMASDRVGDRVFWPLSTEIRVRAGGAALLAGHFGSSFSAYRSRTSQLTSPFIR